jgi:hypothetical protein
MFVRFEIASKDLVDSLLTRDCEDSDMLSEHVGNLKFAALLGQFANYVVHVLPPFDLILGFELQILSTGTVVLHLTGGSVDLGPRFPGAAIEPVSDISPGGPNPWSYFFACIGDGVRAMCCWISEVRLYTSPKSTTQQSFAVLCSATSDNV